MPSSSTVRATQSIEPSDAVNIRCAVSRPYFSISRRASSFSPVSTIPPLRELAPQPILWASSTTTFAPLRASTRAAERPVYPAPMTATSARSGRGSGASTAGIDTPSIQKVCSSSGIVLGFVRGARIQTQEQAWVKGLPKKRLFLPAGEPGCAGLVAGFWGLEIEQLRGTRLRNRNSSEHPLRTRPEAVYAAFHRTFTNESVVDWYDS